MLNGVDTGVAPIVTGGFMAKSSRSDLRSQAAAIHDRLQDKDFPMNAAFKPRAQAFVVVATAFEASAAAVDAAEQEKSDALDAIGAADDGLDASLDAYADALSAAGLGPRLNPFKPFSKHSPSALKALAYAKEAEAARALVAAVAKKSPPAAVKKAGAGILARCTEVEKALKAYGKPSTAYQKALAVRDARLLEVQKAIKALKTHAASAYADDEATVKALFAPADAVQAPKQRRAKKAAKTVENGAPVA
jgi:hypothetical protein